MPQEDLDTLISEAIALKHRVAVEGPEVAEAMLGAQIGRLSGQMDLDDLLPGEEKVLGMAARKKDGKSFADHFMARIRKNLCAEGGEFARLIRDGLTTSVGATLTALVAALGLPQAALPLLIPIAVLICNSGLLAFCDVTDPAA